MKNFKKILILALALLLSLSALVACDNAEAESTSESGTEAGTEAEEKLVDFDYESADLSQYITLSASEYAALNVTIGKEYKFDESAVDDYINKELFKQKKKTDGDTKVTDQPIKLGDSAYIYYTGYLNGEAFDGGSNADAENPSELSIGSGSFIDGFEEGLIGVIPSATSKDSPHELNLTFPEDYHSTDLAGKSVVFKVWVEYIVQYTIPEFNDDFVKNVLEYDGTAEEYRAEIRSDLEDEYEDMAEAEALSAVISKLIEASAIIEYPQESVDYWYATYVDDFEYYMQYYTMYGYSFKSLDEFVTAYLGLAEGEDWKEITMGYAKDMVANSLVYHTVAKQQGFTATAEEINELAADIAEENSTSQKIYTVEEVIEIIGESKLRESIIFEKVEELLLNNTTIEFEAE